VPKHRVVVVLFPGVELLDLAGPLGVMDCATRLLPPGHGYQMELVAQEVGAVETASGMEVVARRSFEELEGPIGTLLVGGATREVLANQQGLWPHLARLARRAERTVGVCTGALLLADAGLLQGKRAVTHWAAVARMRRHHPACEVQEDPIYVRDGSVWTSAGVTAGIDLALALVEQDHGSELALEVARWLVVYLHRPGGQNQFAGALPATRPRSEALTRVVAYIHAHPERDLSASALAQQAGCSERTLSRMFSKELGATPASYVESVRIELARRALEKTRKPVKVIAQSTGFGALETMGRAFQRALGVSPSEYRARFHADTRPQRKGGGVRAP
jgi:transcriptional regulator GlxA family with amidase domain